MEDLNTRLAQLLTSPDIAPTPTETCEWQEKYPYFTVPALMLLKRAPGEVSAEMRASLKARIALNAPDPGTLMALLADPTAPERPEPFYPDNRSARPATDDAIDTFLNHYGHSDPKETALLERLIFNPTPDYSTLLAREEEQSLPPEPPAAPAEGTPSQQQLIDAFIRSRKLPAEEPQPEPPTPRLTEQPHPSAPAPDDSSLSESLAKIYIRRKRYDKAFEIIHTLSLKNPKKSAYFADQLRFLRKLMLVRGIPVPGDHDNTTEK